MVGSSFTEYLVRGSALGFKNPYVNQMLKHVVEGCTRFMAGHSLK